MAAIVPIQFPDVAAAEQASDDLRAAGFTDLADQIEAGVRPDVSEVLEALSDWLDEDAPPGQVAQRLARLQKVGRRATGQRRRGGGAALRGPRR
jgi:hypothetical protein